jgi:hypothetical protein
LRGRDRAPCRILSCQVLSSYRRDPTSDAAVMPALNRAAAPPPLAAGSMHALVASPYKSAYNVRSTPCVGLATAELRRSIACWVESGQAVAILCVGHCISLQFCTACMHPRTEHACCLHAGLQGGAAIVAADRRPVDRRPPSTASRG